MVRPAAHYTLDRFRMQRNCAYELPTISLRNETKKLPAQKAGGLYKGNPQNVAMVFVEASPSRALRDGEGIFRFKIGPLPFSSGVEICVLWLGVIRASVYFCLLILNCFSNKYIYCGAGMSVA